MSNIIEDKTKAEASEKYVDFLLQEHESLESALKAKSEEILDLQLQREELEEKIREIEYANSSLKQNFKSTEEVEIDIPRILSFFQEDKAPATALKLTEYFFSKNIIVLESAYLSAQKSESFKHTDRLLEMLHKLSTEFHSGMCQGGGNNTRHVFTQNEYAANESEGTSSNTRLRKLRTFKYKGEEVYMDRHLKIGIEDNPTHTLRVHFHWDSEEQKIVIGYCGPHLEIMSR